MIASNYKHNSIINALSLLHLKVIVKNFFAFDWKVTSLLLALNNQRVN